MNVLIRGSERWIKHPILWGYPPPDQLSKNYDYFEFANGQKLPRGCTRAVGMWDAILRLVGLRATGCPGVLLFGELNNWRNSPAVKLDERWQLFGADALAWSEYQKKFSKLDREQKNNIGRAHRALNGNAKALCNNGGFNDPNEPRWDFVLKKDEGSELPVRDHYRGMVTVAVEILEKRKNDHGLEMGMVNSFIWEEGPPRNYDFSNMDKDSRMFVGTNQYAGGAVGKFPQINGDVYFPFITRANQPAWYPTEFLEFSDQRRSFYYVL